MPPQRQFPRGVSSAELSKEEVYRFANALHRSTTEDFIFTDPLTGDDLPRDRIPDFLSRDQELHEGQQFLEDFAQHFNVEIVLADHTPNSRESLGDDDFGFEERIKQADVVLLETLGWNQRQKELFNKLSKGELSSPEFDELTTAVTAYLDAHGTRQVGDTYQVRKLAAIANSQAAISFFDVEEKHDPQQMRKKIIMAAGIVNEFDTMATPPDVSADEAVHIKKRARTLSIAALEAVREWHMVANAGFQVFRLVVESPALQEKLRQGTLRVLMVAGDAHRDLVRKFAALGVTVTGSPATAKESETTKYISKWLSTGRIPKDDLDS